MGNLVDYAKREMDLAWPEHDDMQDLVKKNVIEIVQTFIDQGHSGLSAAYILRILRRVLYWNPIGPLMGYESEWGPAYGDMEMQQNKRCSHVFREHYDNRTAHDINGKVFSDDGGETWYSCRESSVPVTFPYYPPDEPERIVLNIKNHPEVSA